MSLLKISAISLLFAFVLPGSVLAKTEYIPYPTNLIVVNETGKSIPVKVRTYGHAVMLNASNPIPPGTTILKSENEDLNDDVYRFSLTIGDEKNQNGQCYAVALSIFGAGVDRQSDGSSGFQCFMVSPPSPGETYLAIRPVK